LSAYFREKRGSSTNEFWRQKTRVHGLSRGVVYMILRLAVLIQYRHVTDKQIYTQNTTTANTRTSLAPGGKNVSVLFETSTDNDAE